MKVLPPYFHCHLNLIRRRRRRRRLIIIIIIIINNNNKNEKNFRLIYPTLYSLHVLGSSIISSDANGLFVWVCTCVSSSESSSVTHTTRGVEFGVWLKQSWHNGGNILIIARRHWGEPPKTSVRLADDPVDIWTDPSPHPQPPAPRSLVFWFLFLFYLHFVISNSIVSIFTYNVWTTLSFFDPLLRCWSRF